MRGRAQIGIDARGGAVLAGVFLVPFRFPMKTFRFLVVSLAVGWAASFAARGAESGLQVLADVAFLGAERTEKLDVYLPETSSEALRPAVVWIHGGGWRGGTKNEARAKNICGTLAKAGYVAVSIDYKLGDGAWPTNLHDCKNAVRFLRANAAKYRIDPARIAVAGGSAGGHLALMVALTADRKELSELEPSAPYPGVSSAVKCVVNFYGITNLLTRKRAGAGVEDPTATQKLMASALALFGADSLDAPVLRVASPVTHVRKDSVPMLTLHGKADTTVDYPQGEELDRVAKERGARHELILLEGVGHTFDLERWGKKPLPRDLRPVMLEFLERNMGGK